MPVVPTSSSSGAPDALVRRLRAAGCVFAEDEARLLREAVAGGSEADAAGRLERLVRRRVDGEPLEQVLGWAEFEGLRILLEPGVFVPRRRTGFLARHATRLSVEAAHRRGRAPVVVDLCCGAGAIGAVVAAALAPDPVELVAADLDPAAVRAARRNLEPLGALVLEGDLFAALPSALRGRIDVLAVNAPYVPTAAVATMPAEARDHEARMALDGGSDGLDVHRRVAASAALWLAPGGRLLVETSESQADGTRALVEAGGLEAHVERDEAQDATVVIGRHGR
jgi:release factor glutamine methyltransferase